MYLARRVKHIHIASFDRPLMSLKNAEEILELIMQEWQKYGDKSTHQIVFPRLIRSIQWRYDYFIFRKKAKRDVQQQ